MLIHKATDFAKLNQGQVEELRKKNLIASVKYDGHQIFIQKKGRNVRLYTSGGKAFSLPEMEQLFEKLDEDINIAAEFMYSAQGKLGDRTSSAILTTFRTLHKNKVAVTEDMSKVAIRMFAIVKENMTYADMLNKLTKIQCEINDSRILCVSHKLNLSLDQVFDEAKTLWEQGWEGLIVGDAEAKYKPGKRTRDFIKIKNRRTVDLLCVGVEEGLGKCNGIGALILEDSEGRQVKVGSGLDYSEGTRQGDFVGKVIEISYEQILDTYIQPVFIRVREDKEKGSID